MSCSEFARLLTNLNTRIKASKRLSKYVISRYYTTTSFVQIFL